MGAVETLIVWEALDINRLVIKNPHTDTKEVKFLSPEQEKQQEEKGLFKDPESGVKLDLEEKTPFVEWIVENYKQFGAKLEFVTDASQEGNQFVKGFGGVGGILRYKVEFDDMDETNFGDGGLDSDD